MSLTKRQSIAPSHILLRFLLLWQLISTLLASSAWPGPEVLEQTLTYNFNSYCRFWHASTALAYLNTAGLICLARPRGTGSVFRAGTVAQGMARAPLQPRGALLCHAVLCSAVLCSRQEATLHPVQQVKRETGLHSLWSPLCCVYFHDLLSSNCQFCHQATGDSHRGVSLTRSIFSVDKAEVRDTQGHRVESTAAIGLCLA